MKLKQATRASGIQKASKTGRFNMHYHNYRPLSSNLHRYNKTFSDDLLKWFHLHNYYILVKIHVERIEQNRKGSVNLNYYITEIKNM